jgi:nitrate/nitrite transporter NarK
MNSLSILAVTLMILLGLDFGGETFPWNSPKIICLLIFGTVAIFIFVFSEMKFARYPLMPLALFQVRSNVAILIITLCQGVVFIGVDYYMPLYLQSTHSASPSKSGLLVLPYMVTSAVMGFVCGIITHKYSAYRALICAGTTTLTLGMGLFIAFGAETSIAMIAGIEVIAGVGAGLLFQPTVIAIQAFTAQDDIATAIATLEFVRSMGVRTPSYPLLAMTD